MLFRPQYSKRRTNMLQPHPGLPCPNPSFLISINRLKHVVGQYFQILLSSFSIRNNSAKTWNQAKKLRNFELFHPGVTMIAIDFSTRSTEILWITNEPCGHYKPWLLYFYIHFYSKFSTSHSIKVLKLCQLISSRIIAVINTMSTCQSKRRLLNHQTVHYYLNS